MRRAHPGAAAEQALGRFASDAPVNLGPLLTRSLQRSRGREAFVANPSHIVEPADLSEALCFDLCATGRAVTRAYRPLLSSLGLTYPQYLVMVALRQRAPRTVSELGDRLELDSGTLSPLLKRLDASGLVTRGRRHEDERAVEVALTSKGTALLREAAGVPNKMATVMGLSAEAGHRLRTLLKQVTTSLARHHDQKTEGAEDGRRQRAVR